MEGKDTTHVPKCIGVIIDGNRRWAKEQGVSVKEGHEIGYKKLKEFGKWARDAGVKHVIAYVFSTENWNRSREEVNNLMNLVRFVFKKDSGEFKKEGIRIRVIGEKERLDEDIQKMVADIETETKDANQMDLVLALSYGGRSEIVAAANKLVEQGDNVTEESFSRALWTAGAPDPDMIIRTGGEKRLSNFLPWQSVYSELFFTDTFWPGYTKEEFEEMLNEFSVRERRRGR